MTHSQSPDLPITDTANIALTASEYMALYNQSINDPEQFWRTQGQILDWITPYSQVKETSFAANNVFIRWYQDGTLNVSINCLDRHLLRQPDKTAIIWQGDDPADCKKISYRQLHEQVCRFASVLKNQGIQRGDVVAIYMPMIPEAAVAMLACTRIGAIHTVIFAGFSAESVAGRIADCNANLIITADQGRRAGKIIALKDTIDQALRQSAITSVRSVIVFKNTGHPIKWDPQRDQCWQQLMDQSQTDVLPEQMNAEDPLFILYTSGSTGQPKGVMHTTGGYLVYATTTFKYAFNYQPEDIYWCTADIGWITGHSYLLYGPLSYGATTLMYEGVPNWPSSARLAQIIDKHQVSILYTAPTAIRGLMAEGDNAIAGTYRSSLRILGSVGEPINPEAWDWFYQKIGNQHCPIIDTWWQTETGGFMITPLPNAMTLKPGSASKPFFGIKPELIDNAGNILTGSADGILVIADSWPGQARSLFGNHQRFEQVYFNVFPNYFFTGDGARRDADGDYWITGRVDDVLNVSGHRLGTAEIESALVAHPKIAEAAVVGIPHAIKGQAICAYITLNHGELPNNTLYHEVQQWVRKEIGPIATPDQLHWAEGLPKTRSGKIMRRILRKIASGETDSLGDISTLADPEVIDQLLNKRLSGE